MWGIRWREVTANVGKGHGRVREEGGGKTARGGQKRGESTRRESGA